MARQVTGVLERAASAIAGAVGAVATLYAVWTVYVAFVGGNLPLSHWRLSDGGLLPGVVALVVTPAIVASVTGIAFMLVGGLVALIVTAVRAHPRVATGLLVVALVAAGVGSYAGVARNDDGGGPSTRPVAAAASPTSGAGSSSAVPAASASPGVTNPAATFAGIDGEQFGAGTVDDGPALKVSYLGSSLVRRTALGFSFLAPSKWAESDQSIPSDHSDVLFYDPNNSTARIEIVASGCVGCVTDAGANPQGDPAEVLPAHVTSSFRVNASTVGFAEQSWLGYYVNGSATLIESAGGVQGYTIVRVALPATDNSLATKILNSVRPIGDDSDSLVDRFVGDWTGHGRNLQINSDGSGLVLYRIYTFCTENPTPPCDEDQGGDIIDGGRIELHLDSAYPAGAATIAQGRILSSTDPTVPLGAITLRLDDGLLSTSFSPGAPFCGPGVGVQGECGA